MGLLVSACQTTPEAKQEIQTPKYAADVPEYLLAPDKMKTDLLGDLEFFDGMPNEATVNTTYEFLDLSRGVDAFLSVMPATSIYAMLEGLKDAGIKTGDLAIFDNLLDGGKTYKVTLPATIPVNNFWSFMVYSGQHRSMLETDQKSAGLDSNIPDIKANEDGSYTVWFAPEAPVGHEGNWIQTMLGKSTFVLLRLYGPLQPWFDKTWKPNDFELVN